MCDKWQAVFAWGGGVGVDCMGKGNRTRQGQPPATIIHKSNPVHAVVATTNPVPFSYLGLLGTAIMLRAIRPGGWASHMACMRFAQRVIARQPSCPQHHPSKTLRRAGGYFTMR